MCIGEEARRAPRRSPGAVRSLSQARRTTAMGCLRPRPATAPQAADTPCAAEALRPARRCRPVRRALTPRGLRVVAALRAAAAGLRSAAVLCAEPHGTRTTRLGRAPRPGAAAALRRPRPAAGHRRCSACDRAPRPAGIRLGPVGRDEQEAQDKIRGNSVF